MPGLTEPRSIPSELSRVRIRQTRPRERPPTARTGSKSNSQQSTSRPVSRPGKAGRESLAALTFAGETEREDDEEIEKADAAAGLAAAEADEAFDLAVSAAAKAAELEVLAQKVAASGDAAEAARIASLARKAQEEANKAQ